MSELLEFLRTHEEAFRSRARLASLYSDFRYQRHSNPDGYHANVTAWQRALASAARAGFLPAPTNAVAAQNSPFVIHSGDKLAGALQTPDLGRPLSLGTVIEESLAKNEMVPLKAFLEAKNSIYARSWIPSLGEVVRWGLKQVGVGGGSRDSSGEAEKVVEGDFVIVSNVESAAKAILDTAAKVATSNTSRIFSKDLFVSTFTSALGERSISPADLSILLTHLQRDRSAIAYSAATGTIKFKAPGEAQPSPITDEDRSIASLRTLIASLEPQIQQLTDRVNSRDAAAREAVAKKQLTVAKTTLRQKKLADAALQQRTATLTQLEEVYAKIEQAADQIEVVRVMEAAGYTLKSLNAQTGGVEKVQDVMDGLREQMLDTDEITQAITENSSASIDEGEVDDELEALEKEERRKQDEAERKAKARADEEEAEETRKKLAQLDQMGEKKAAEDTTTPPDEPLRAFEDKNDEAMKIAETAV